MNKVVVEKELNNENVKCYTLAEHDHEIYSLLIELTSREVLCERGADDFYLVGKEGNMCPLVVPEIKAIEKLADCQCYKHVNKDQVEYLWVPFEIFDED